MYNFDAETEKGIKRYERLKEMASSDFKHKHKRYTNNFILFNDQKKSSRNVFDYSTHDAKRSALKCNDSLNTTPHLVADPSIQALSLSNSASMLTLSQDKNKIMSQRAIASTDHLMPHKDCFLHFD